MTNPFFQKTDYEQENKNNMVYWYPLLKQIRMRVPDTIFVHSGNCDLLSLSDGKDPKGLELFMGRLEEVIKEIGMPCFLRTGMMSGKHSWKDTCYIDKLDDLKSHIASLVEESCIANIAGLPFDFSIWAVRKLISTTPLFTAFYGDMPITRERRLFIRDGKLECNHPYWPKESFEGEENWTQDLQDELDFIDTPDQEELKQMAEYVGKYFTGYWSLDFLQDRDFNWWLTDMAVGERSYHYSHGEK